MLRVIEPKNLIKMMNVMPTYVLLFFVSPLFVVIPGLAIAQVKNYPPEVLNSHPEKPGDGQELPEEIISRLLKDMV